MPECVLALSRVAIQFVEKSEDANGDDELDSRLGRCGMEPARIRDKRADLPAAADAPLLDLLTPPVIELLAGLKGLVDGVGRVDDLAEDCCC